jgi:hypothetical protein
VHGVFAEVSHRQYVLSGFCVQLLDDNSTLAKMISENKACFRRYRCYRKGELPPDLMADLLNPTRIKGHSYVRVSSSVRTKGMGMCAAPYRRGLLRRNL